MTAIVVRIAQSASAPSGAAGLLVYVITMSLAAVDWIMSMDPQWYSTVFGFIVCMGQAVAGISVLIIMLQLASAAPVFASRLQPAHFNDLATLLVTAVILWAYNAFAQLLITWMGNVQNEVHWYVQRTNGPWRVMSIILCAFGFLAPFVLLLQHSVKKRGRAMLWVCLGLLGMRLLDVYWMVARGRRGGSAFALVECVDERCCVNGNWRSVEHCVSLATRRAAAHADRRLNARRRDVGTGLIRLKEH